MFISYPIVSRSTVTLTKYHLGINNFGNFILLLRYRGDAFWSDQQFCLHTRTVVSVWRQFSPDKCKCTGVVALLAVAIWDKRQPPWNGMRLTKYFARLVRNLSEVYRFIPNVTRISQRVVLRPRYIQTRGGLLPADYKVTTRFHWTTNRFWIKQI